MDEALADFDEARASMASRIAGVSAAEVLGLFGLNPECARGGRAARDDAGIASGALESLALVFLSSFVLGYGLQSTDWIRKLLLDSLRSS